FGLNLMHITVDGKPLDDPDRSSADVQRCTDVALDKANIQFQFDNLKARRRLSVTASPSLVPFQPVEEEGLVAQPVHFRMYSNYGAYIERAEVRIFDAAQSEQSQPLDVVTVDVNGFADWQPVLKGAGGPERELKYVLRVYGEAGRFDDTSPQPLWMIQDPIDPQIKIKPKRVPHKPRVEAAPDSQPSILTTDSGTTINFEIPDENAAGSEVVSGSGSSGTTVNFEDEAPAVVFVPEWQQVDAGQIGVTTNFETGPDVPGSAQAATTLR